MLIGDDKTTKLIASLIGNQFDGSLIGDGKCFIRRIMKVLLCFQFEPLFEGQWVMANRMLEDSGMIFSCEV